MTLSRTEGSAADFVRAALGVDHVEANLGLVNYTALPLLEAALDRLGDEDSVARARVLGRLGRALSHQGDHQRATAILAEAIALARRCGDSGALSDALDAQQVTLSGWPCPGAQFAERRQALDEMLAAAEEIGDVSAVVEAEMWRVSGFLELCDRVSFETSLKRFGDFSERYQLSNFGWGLGCAGALRAILCGQFAEAERLADRAFEIGREVHGELAIGVYGVQMFTIRREQGRLAEVAPLFRRFLDENPGDTVWRPGLAVIASDLGFDEAARKALADMASMGLPADARRSLTLSYLAEVCARLGDAARAEWLYHELLPYRDNMILAPVATVCCGAAARYLGMLAGTMENWTASEEHSRPQ